MMLNLNISVDCSNADMDGMPERPAVAAVYVFQPATPGERILLSPSRSSSEV